MRFSGENRESVAEEVLGTEDLALRDKLSGLRRVEAPSDFDFRLKARIAKGRPQARWPVTGRSAAFVLPAIAAAVIAGTFFIPSTPAPATAEIGLTPVPAATTPAVELAAAETDPTQIGTTANAQPAAAEPKRTAATASSRQILPHRRDETDKTGFGGSFDSAIQSSDPILPRGFDLRKGSNANAGSPGPKRSVEIGQILKVLGIDAVRSGKGWRVRAVTENSISQRSGIAAGDVITAIDDRSLANGSAFENDLEVKSLTVDRQGRSLSIELRAQ